MLSVVNSGKFILTLQSTPPFVIESIFAVALAVLLAVPLVTNLQFYLEESFKRKRNARNSTVPDIRSNESNRLKKNQKEIKRNENSSERIRRTVVMHYPAPISIDTSSSSDLDPQVSTLSRRSVSTPNVRSNCVEDERNYKTLVPRNDQQRVNEFVKKIKPRKDALLDGSSSFVATNLELPIIDISTFNYNSYRHKLIEASLKKRYRERQPPGDVIFNSIHLNTTDSILGLKLNEEYDHSFFDFVEEYYDATAGMSRKEMEFLHPLDHFLVRSECKRETSEKATETINPIEKETDQCGGSIVDNKPHTLDKNGNITKAKGKHFSKISKKLDNLDENRGETIDSSLIGVPRMGRKRSPGRKSSNETLNSRKPTSSIVKAGKDSINVSSSSSDELGSAYSETEKKPSNATSNHSRDSSAPPSRGRPVTRKLLPWITGNPTVSFNRKYGNKSPETIDSSSKRKVRSSERPSTRLHSGKASPRPRSANLATTLRKTNYQNSLELEETEREKPPASISPSRISSPSSSKLLASLPKNDYGRSMLEKRDRAAEIKMTKTTAKDDQETITAEINYQDQATIELNFGQSNSNNQLNKTFYASDRTNFTSTGEINKAESWKESTLRLRNNESKPRNDSLQKKETRRRLKSGLSNFDKTRKISGGDKSERSSRDKTGCSRSAIESTNTLVLATNDSRTEKYSFGNELLSKECDDVTDAKNLTNEGLRLPGNDSKIGLAMQTSLKNYIKTLKEVLKNGGNVDMVDLASLSLKDAISPELESVLSSSELKELQDLLNIAEIKSNLVVKDVSVI